MKLNSEFGSFPFSVLANSFHEKLELNGWMSVFALNLEQSQLLENFHLEKWENSYCQLSSAISSCRLFIGIYFLSYEEVLRCKIGFYDESSSCRSCKISIQKCHRVSEENVLLVDMSTIKTSRVVVWDWWKVEALNFHDRCYISGLPTICISKFSLLNFVRNFSSNLKLRK